ncbi:mCG147210 [Mus musculus]|nr:mCG147210 [Mus musculus]
MSKTILKQSSKKEPALPTNQTKQDNLKYVLKLHLYGFFWRGPTRLQRCMCGNQRTIWGVSSLLLCKRSNVSHQTWQCLYLTSLKS